MDKQQLVKVGIDIRDLKFAKTGQKTILEEYYKQFLQNNDPEIQFVYIDAELPEFARNFKLGIILNHLIYQWWKQVLLPFKAWRNKVDVLFCCDYFAPILTPGFKNVQVYYDAFFYEYPEHYNQQWMRIFKLFAIPAAKGSAFIVTISQYSKQKIHQHIQIPLEKIISIYPGPKSLPTIKNKEDILFTPPKADYLLHVGVWEKRKNIPLLLKAFRQLLDETNQPFKLVLVGDGNKRMNSDDSEAIHSTIEQLKLKDSVICTGYLSDASVAKAYEYASLYVFPSYNEGFGIPILEAFRFNVPVLVANNSCLPEVGGDAVICFDPFSATDLAEKMKEVLTNQTLKEKLKIKGKERLSYFTWPRASDELKEVFKTVAKNG
jgi:glycosyltransferase involved in cell wall biosynthesis